MRIWTDLVALGTPALEIVLRTAAVYAVILVGFRLTGKREIGQFTPFDLVLVLLIANAVQNAMVGSDSSLLGGIIAAVVLLGANWLLGVIAGRSRAIQDFAVGTPTLLVHDGKVITENMRRENVDDGELMAALREHGIEKVSDVRLAVLEIDGSISVVPRDQKVLRTRRRVRQFKRRD